MKKQLFVLILLTLFKTVRSQSVTYTIATIAFYNLENLFDSEDNPSTFDHEYTPTGKHQWTSEKVALKLNNLTRVIADIGTEKNNLSPAIIGLAEVENKKVLQQLVQHKNLNTVDYDIVHYDSPDKRGIDVALLFDRNRFKLAHSQKHELFINDQFNNRVYTRDQLCVSGFLRNNLLYCIVNHWPSRRGGVKISEYKRIEAAKLTKKITDSIFKITPNANIVIMGDFNDDPTNKSFKKILDTKVAKNLHINTPYLYNPFEKMKKKGLGTLAYRDKWNVFDQLIFSSAMLDHEGIQLYETKIFSAKYLIETVGKYKGYPKRSAHNVIHGFSDHFPVYSYLITPKK